VAEVVTGRLAVPENWSSQDPTLDFLEGPTLGLLDPYMVPLEYGKLPVPFMSPFYSLII
jgi:hypothetical protein